MSLLVSKSDSFGNPNLDGTDVQDFIARQLRALKMPQGDAKIVAARTYLWLLEGGFLDANHFSYDELRYNLDDYFWQEEDLKESSDLALEFVDFLADHNHWG